MKPPDGMEETMISQMNLVQDAARMAMADHRAAAPRSTRRPAFGNVVLAAIAGLLRRLGLSG